MAPSTRVAIVTGGNSGMGMALARDLVKTGWKVAIADINENPGLAKELGDAASFHKCNVADYDSQVVTFQEVWDKHGQMDALCANAGIVDRSSIYILDHRNSDKIPPKPDLLCTDVDYKGVVYGTQLAIYFMRKNKYDGAKAAVVNFVRAVAPILKDKDNISINCVMPGIVHTSIIPQAMIDAVSEECLTPQSTIVAAYQRCLEDDSLFGKVIECSADKQFFLETPSLKNGRISQRAVTVWDPLFKMYGMHHELSGLPDAIP
ncbi:15-hydroxyprostaglandin dehydrogenase [Clohesyomyces aquaticus]|uniref:15-hydroxyprostaglandin dehydrogenase n=1 Tax=Clohesyomyces aquaticus TaxID=1231657 RepID=A0A1Y1ZFH2_9PLEO|nr:15-hydroxyprostaglandin dehydrogenase [Clohesyomyces aquaticus]